MSGSRKKMASHLKLKKFFTLEEISTQVEFEIYFILLIFFAIFI